MKLGRAISALVAALIAAQPLVAYYHYIHYASRTGPFTPIYERFANNTVSFFVSDQGPTTYAPNDGLGSVLSQIRQALGAWDSIPNSDLHLTFGGLEAYSPNPSATAPGGALAAPATPSADVVFIDLPGVYGLGAPTVAKDPVTGANGQQFYPIVRGIVMLSRDTTKGAGPSYLEGFFTTAVHEIGHAIGLQHTWTSSAMSQDVIRNTSRARPLDADDIAAFSILYGKANWQSNYGAISGRVTFANGQPAALASVVAIMPVGPAVSSLTDPNGNYRIDGLPTGNYLVYAHPLPPDALLADSSGLRLPMDQNGASLPASGAFQTSFFPGTLDPLQASVVVVGNGQTITPINFSVQARASVPTYDVITYGRLDTAARNYIYSGDTTVTGYPAFISSNLSPVIAQAAPPAVLPVPQSVTMLGGFAPALLSNSRPPQVIPYSSQPGDPIAIYFSFGFSPGVGPRHLVFNFGTDIYVLPDAVDLVQKGPPLVTAVKDNGDGTVSVAGAGFAADSSVYFDGLKAVIGAFSGNDAAGTITVTPPPGAAGQTAVITVSNPDGQNSMILQAQNPPLYSYPAGPAASITSVSVTALPAGATAAIEINGSNTNFVEGRVTVGFGSADVSVRRVWVLSATRAVANVAVAANASLALSEISVISGLQALPVTAQFQTQPARASQPVISLPVVNADPAQQTVYPGSFAALYGQNLAAGSTNPVVTLNDVPLNVQFASPNQVNVFIPNTFAVGPALLKLSYGGQSAFPVEMQVDTAPPLIVGVLTASGQPLGLGAQVNGDSLNVLVTGLDAVSATRAKVFVGGIEMPITQITAAANGQFQLTFLISKSFNGAQVPLTVSLDGATGAAWALTVR